MTDSLLQEVDNDLRQERLYRLWQQYRLPLAAALVALVVATAATNIWRDYQAKKAGEAMRALDAAILQSDAGHPADAAKQLADLAQHSHGELNDLARLWQARAQALANDAAGSVKTLSDLADHPQGRDLIWRDLACLRLLSAGADAPKNCAGVDASPLKSQRLEWHAALLWSQGKSGEARSLLNAIVQDETTPKSQRDRAARLMRALPAAGAK